MELEKQVCSLELAKKLKELGVKQESLFWWYFDKKSNGNWGEPDDPKYSYLWDVTYSAGLMKLSDENAVSAFTVAELGEMLPKECWSRRANGGEHFYWCSWKTEKNEMHTPGDTEANARAKMLVYLLENNLITSE